MAFDQRSKCLTFTTEDWAGVTEEKREVGSGKNIAFRHVTSENRVVIVYTRKSVAFRNISNGASIIRGLLG